MPEQPETFDLDVQTRGTPPLVLLRYRPGQASETARAVHLVSLPIARADEVTALCGELLHPDQVERANPDHGMNAVHGLPAQPYLDRHHATPIHRRLPNSPTESRRGAIGCAPLPRMG